METILTFISVVFCILSTILFFKVWGMCNNVCQIKDRLGAGRIHIDELIYLSKTNDPTFTTKLQKAVYDDFYRTHQAQGGVDAEFNFKRHREQWIKRCEYYNWEFPEIFSDINTLNDFKAFIAPKNLY